MNMKFEDGTPVKHKRDGYMGVTDGYTTIKEVFTGNTNSEWQYRIAISKGGNPKIAPEEDLEIIDDQGDIDALRSIRDTRSGDPQDESPLYKMGYNVTSKGHNERIKILDIAIEKLGFSRVFHYLLYYIKGRAASSERAKKYYNALYEWHRDLMYIIDTYQNEISKAMCLEITEIQDKLREFNVITRRAADVTEK